LAYVYTPALREAFRGLDQVNWQEYFRGWLDLYPVTEADLAEGVRLFVEAHKLFCHEPEILCPADALRQVGFLDLPYPVRIMIYCRIGEVITGGFFVAVRDVTSATDVPPPAVELEAMLAAGRAISKAMGCRETLVPPTLEQVEEARARAELAEESQRLQREETDQWRKRWQAELENARKLVESQKQLQSQVDQLKAALATERSKPWWQRLSRWRIPAPSEPSTPT